MASLVLDIAEVGRDGIEVVGAKGATLGELSRLDDFVVPPGFCVTTHSFRRAVGATESFERALNALLRLRSGDRQAIRDGSAQVRAAVEGVAVAPRPMARSSRASTGCLPSSASTAPPS